MIRRGFLYWGSLADDPKRRRPVLVVSPDARNESAGARTVIVVPATTRRRGGPFRVPLHAEAAGVPRGSELACEQIAQLPKERLSPSPLGGPLPGPRMQDVVRGILYAIGAGAIVD